METYFCNVSRSHGGGDSCWSDDNNNLFTDSLDKLIEFVAGYRAWNIEHAWEIKHSDYPYEIDVFAVIGDMRVCIIDERGKGVYLHDYEYVALQPPTAAQLEALQHWLANDWVQIMARIEERAAQLVGDSEQKRIAKAKAKADEEAMVREKVERAKLAELLQKYGSTGA